MRKYIIEDKQLMSQWDYSKNTLDPQSITKGSEKKAWWICSKGHSIEQPVFYRAKTKRCPICSGHKLLTGFNDLATTHPKLLLDWDYNKNNDINIYPTKITKGSDKKVWWKCNKCGNNWLATINSRALGTGCPKCGLESISKKLVKKAIMEKGSIKDNYPEIVKEWDYEKNLGLRPENFSCGSEKKVWWKCECGHSYQMQIDLKLKRKYKCPICSKGLHTSFPEKAIAYYVSKIDNSIVEGYSNKEKNISEIDIFIPKKQIGIEYDGSRWHNGEKNKVDIKKNLICINNGIKLYRVREMGCKRIVNSTSIDIYYDSNNIEELNDVIHKLIYLIYKKNIDVDVKRDEIDIYKKIEMYKDDKSALHLTEEILSEWDYEKNLGLRPENFSLNSHISVWWKCKKCGGSWKTAISNRYNNRNCPYCSGHKLLTGYNDLETINPLLINEWDYNKNTFLPSQVTAHSSKDVWWICPKGHSYKARISNRNDLGRGCSICANKKIIKGINDLETKFPNVFKEWDYEMNKDLNPYEIAPGTAKKVHFICSKCGNKWLTLLSDRTKNGTGCPKCANSRKGEKLKISICKCSLDGKVIKKYESSSVASKETGISRSAICQALKGRAKTSGGYIWKYEE